MNKYFIIYCTFYNSIYSILYEVNSILIRILPYSSLHKTRSEISNLLGSIIQFLPSYSIHSPQTSQIHFSPISRGGINWAVCRSNSLGTSYSTHWLVHASSRNWRKLDLRGLRRMNWTMQQFWRNSSNSSSHSSRKTEEYSWYYECLD